MYTRWKLPCQLSEISCANISHKPKIQVCKKTCCDRTMLNIIYIIMGRSIYTKSRTCVVHLSTFWWSRYDFMSDKDESWDQRSPMQICSRVSKHTEKSYRQKHYHLCKTSHPTMESQRTTKFPVMSDAWHLCTRSKLNYRQKPRVEIEAHYLIPLEIKYRIIYTSMRSTGSGMLATWWNTSCEYLL